MRSKLVVSYLAFRSDRMTSLHWYLAIIYEPEHVLPNETRQSKKASRERRGEFPEGTRGDTSILTRNNPLPHAKRQTSAADDSGKLSTSEVAVESEGIPVETYQASQPLVSKTEDQGVTHPDISAGLSNRHENEGNEYDGMTVGSPR